MKCLADTCLLATVLLIVPSSLILPAAAGQQVQNAEQTVAVDARERWTDTGLEVQRNDLDRKSTRLNSSH